MPNLDRLIESGGLGAMSVRTGSSHPAVAEGYATLGAGARVRVDNTAAADVASDGFGPVSVAAAADLRRTAGRHLPTRPGDLGEALHAAGRTTAVVGVADIAEGLVGPNVPQDRPARFRPAPLALMDRDGNVDAGQVDASLLMADGTGPFGERADPEKVAAATVRALAEADVVLVDTGDMSRAEALAELAPPVFADLSRGFALEDTDAILGRILADVEPSTLVLVVSVVPPDDEWRLTPVVAAGPGVAPGAAGVAVDQAAGAGDPHRHRPHRAGRPGRAGAGGDDRAPAALLHRRARPRAVDPARPRRRLPGADLLRRRRRLRRGPGPGLRPGPGRVLRPAPRRRPRPGDGPAATGADAADGGDLATRPARAVAAALGPGAAGRSGRGRRPSSAWA